MNEIRKLPAQAARVETGPVQFGEDWPGVFIRGDGAGWYALMLDRLIAESGKDADPLVWLAVKDLRNTLAGAIVGPASVLLQPVAPPTPAPAPSPFTIDFEPACGRCGMKFSSVLGYVCPQPDCPAGLGGTICMAGPAQDPIIGN